MAEAIEALAAAAVPLGLCTSKRADFADQILSLFGIRQHFTFVSGGDIGVRKADQLGSLLRQGVIATSSTMIGDRAIDIVAAKAHSLKAVAVLWGHGSRAEVESAAPDAVLEFPHELLGLAHAA